MNKTVNSRSNALRIFSGVLFILIIAFYALIRLFTHIYNNSFVNFYFIFSNYIYPILFFLFLGFTAVALFIKKPLFAGIGLAGYSLLLLIYFIYSVYDIYQLSYNYAYSNPSEHFRYYIWKYYIWDLIQSLALALAAVVFLTAKKDKAPLKPVWFLPGIIMIIGTIVPLFDIFMEIIEIIPNLDSISSIYFLAMLFEIPFYLCLTAAMFICCAYICGVGGKKVGVAQNNFIPQRPVQNFYAPQQPINYAPRPYTPPVQNNSGFTPAAERELISLKSMLDKGLITEEDYNEKKKQILGI